MSDSKRAEINALRIWRLKRKDFSAQYFYRAQLSSKNRKAFIFSGRLSKLLISARLLKERHDQLHDQINIVQWESFYDQRHFLSGKRNRHCDSFVRLNLSRPGAESSGAGGLCRRGGDSRQPPHPTRIDPLL